MTVYFAHGDAAPRVREAARLRLACLIAPALQVFHEILKAKGHPHRFAAAKEILERNHLHAFGVEPPARGAFPPSVTVHTQVNLAEPRVAEMVAEMSDAEYDRLVTESRELLPTDEPKRIGGVSPGRRH
jgi:hypothetical protein